ncbi:hypothetical protein ABID76_005006 [Burkholderia ambifaria]
MAQLEDPRLRRLALPRLRDARHDLAGRIDAGEPFEQIEADRVARPRFDVRRVERLDFGGHLARQVLLRSERDVRRNGHGVSGGRRQGERGQHGRHGMQGFHRGSLEKVVR